MNKRDLEDRLINFAVLIVKIVEDIPETRSATHLSGQLLRSGTSPALNYGEAQGGESRRDFIHKIKIVLKELRETNEWISIFVKSEETAQKNIGLG